MTSRGSLDVATIGDAESLIEAKAETTIAVVLPALDEEATVGRIVGEIRRDLLASAGPRVAPLVDDLVVLDSGSTDQTARAAADAGARVVHRDDVLPHIPSVPGKGEAMWRAVAATTADIVVFIDADLESFDSSYVVRLVEPLLRDASIDLVKGAYDRPVGDDDVRVGGGRVTELVARPLLNLHWPELTGIVQPLAGEYAARRALLEHLRFPCGYGVEFAMLVDTLELSGPGAIAQVDLGMRRHRHHDDLRLGRMAAEIWQTALTRLDPDGRVRGGMGTTLTQFHRQGDHFVGVAHDIGALERPALNSVPEYAGRR